MDLKRLRNQKKGFTLIELMVVIVIIGILVAIALPNFISAQDRAKVSSVKANMHTFQTGVETYAVDWSGVYPANTAEFRNEGRQTTKGYWKELKNPFSAAVGQSATGAYNTLPGVAAGGNVALLSLVAANMAEGVTGYAALRSATGSTDTSYAIYGAGKNSAPVTDKGSSIFFLSNI